MSDSTLVFFKMASTNGKFVFENDFDAVLAIIDSDMLDNDDIMSVNVSGAVEKIPQMKRLSNTPCGDKSFHLKSKGGLVTSNIQDSYENPRRHSPSVIF